MTQQVRQGTSHSLRRRAGTLLRPGDNGASAWDCGSDSKLRVRQAILTNSAERCFAAQGAKARNKVPDGRSKASGGHSRRRRMERSQANLQDLTLAAIAIFASLPSKTLKAVAQTCSWQPYQSGESVVDYLDASDDVFFVTTGEVSVTIYSASGKAVSFRSLGPGSVFGEYAAIDGDPRCASVLAKTDCLIASMSGQEFRQLLEREPAVGQGLIRELVRNVRTLTKRVYEFSTLAVNNRIQAELLRLASLALREGKTVRLVPPPTHADIASRVSTHREAVTRELNRLSRIGLIERQSGVLIISDVDRLAEMLHEMTGE